MAIAIIAGGWLAVSVGLAYGLSKMIALADRIELGEHDD